VPIPSEPQTVGFTHRYLLSPLPGIDPLCGKLWVSLTRMPCGVGCLDPLVASGGTPDHAVAVGPVNAVGNQETALERIAFSELQVVGELRGFDDEVDVVLGQDPTLVGYVDVNEMSAKVW